MTKFVASFLRGGSLINPDKIEIIGGFLGFRKRRLYLIGYEEQIMNISRISSIKIDAGVIGTNIIITSFGGGVITGHHFSLKDANEIKRLINEKLPQQSNS